MNKKNEKSGFPRGRQPNAACRWCMVCVWATNNATNKQGATQKGRDAFRFKMMNDTTSPHTAYYLQLITYLVYLA